MDGKQYFQECCKQSKIDFDDTFVLSISENRQSKAYRYRLPVKAREYPKLFFVVYIEKADFYIAWSLNRPTKREVFYVSANAANALEPGELRKITKALGHQGHGEEIVYAFDRSAVMDFLKTVNK